MAGSLNTAKALLTAGNYAGARRAAKGVLEDDPENASAVLLLIEIDLDAEDYASALKQLELALANQPDNLSLRAKEIEALIRMGKRRRSRLRIKSFQEDFPFMPALVERNDIMFEMKFGSDQRAAKMMEDGDLDVDSALKGVLSTNSGRLLEGQRFLNEALAENPTDFATNQHLVINQLLLARPLSARRAARRALREQPGNGRMRWLCYLTYFAYFPPIYLMHVYLALCFVVLVRLPYLVAVTLGLVGFLFVVEFIGSLDEAVQNAGVPFFEWFSHAYKITYFVGLAAVVTPLPDKILGSKRKVKLKNY